MDNMGRLKVLTCIKYFSPQTVQEKIVCHAIIGRAGGKIPIIGVDIKAEFIEPLLNFSTKCAFFRVDKVIYNI